MTPKNLKIEDSIFDLSNSLVHHQYTTKIITI